MMLGSLLRFCTLLPSLITAYQAYHHHIIRSPSVCFQCFHQSTIYSLIDLQLCAFSHDRPLQTGHGREETGQRAPSNQQPCCETALNSGKRFYIEYYFEHGHSFYRWNSICLLSTQFSMSRFDVTLVAMI